MCFYKPFRYACHWQFHSIINWTRLLKLLTHRRFVQLIWDCFLMNNVKYLTLFSDRTVSEVCLGVSLPNICKHPVHAHPTPPLAHGYTSKWQRWIPLLPDVHCNRQKTNRVCQRSPPSFDSSCKRRCRSHLVKLAFTFLGPFQLTNKTDSFRTSVFFSNS